MIRRSTRIQLAVFALLTAVGVSIVSAGYLGFTDALLGRGYTVSADFAESGGIFQGAEVTYRGVTVGQVSRLRLSADGVHVDLHITSDRPIPATTRAVVADRSAVGEQYVDLQPLRDAGPFLRDGSRIPQSRTGTPLPTATLLRDVERLVSSVPKDKLVTTIDELDAAFSGTGPDLQRLIDNGDALTQAATQALPTTVRLLTDGRTVLDTQRASRDEIRRFSKGLSELAATLRSSDADLRATLAGGAAAAPQAQELLAGLEPSLGPLLGNLISGAQVTTTHLPGLRQALVTYPYVVKGGYTVVPGDGTAHFGLSFADSRPPCTQGYQGTRHTDPTDSEAGEPPLNTSARCTAPRGSGALVRGAQNAPGASGVSTGDRSPVTSATSPSLSATSTGVVGTFGGQQAVFGRDSWQWLLLGPLSGAATS